MTIPNTPVTANGSGDVSNPFFAIPPKRQTTFPNRHATERRKPRRCPLFLRFAGGTIHGQIALPVFLHALLTALVDCLYEFFDISPTLPSSIIPAFSIVVGLMLVFRNQISYSRFWDGRNNFTILITSVRNLTRSFLCCSYIHGTEPTSPELADVERIVRVLIAIPGSVRSSLRAEWGTAWEPLDESQNLDRFPAAITPRLNPEYAQLLPMGLKGHEDDGLALPLELIALVESFIKRGHDRGWFHSPQASQLTVQLNTLVDAYGKMETIRITPYRVTILIHQKQVLALFGAFLPLTIVKECGWWSILVVSLVMFTLYGIEAIASQLEDPFGYDRSDIKMDAIVEDARTELGVMLNEWKRCNEGPLKRQMFMEEL